MFPEVRAEMARKRITCFQIASDPRIAKSVSHTHALLTGRATLTFAQAVAIKDILKSDLPLEKLFESETEARK